MIGTTLHWTTEYQLKQGGLPDSVWLAKKDEQCYGWQAQCGW